MMKGTYSYTKDEIDELLNRTGASFNIRADFDEISLNLKCLKKFLPTLLPLISEIARVPKLDQKEIDLAKDQLLLELKSEQDHPDSLLGLMLHKSFYKDHPYYHRPSGYLDTVPEIKKEDLSTALFKAFNKENVFFVMVGDLSRAESEEIVSKYFKGLPAGKRSGNFRDPPKNKTGQVETKKFETPTDYFVARFKAPSLESSDYPALAIAIQILDSRFFEEVRTKRALTYAVSASLGNSRINSGSFYVSSPKLSEAVGVMFEVLRKLEQEKISQKLLDQKINKALSSWFSARETRSSQARIFALYETYGIGWENADTYMDRLQKVTPEQIQNVLRKYLKDFTFVVISSSGADISPVLKAAKAL
jgi:zinc protease